jgi:hypothetical protein
LPAYDHERTPGISRHSPRFHPLFATLVGVAVLHRHTLQAALTGLAVIVLYQLGFTGFKTGPGLGGLASHLYHERMILTNLLCCSWVSRCCRTTSREGTYPSGTLRLRT